MRSRRSREKQSLSSIYEEIAASSRLKSGLLAKTISVIPEKSGIHLSGDPSTLRLSSGLAQAQVDNHDDIGADEDICRPRILSLKTLKKRHAELVEAGASIFR